MEPGVRAIRTKYDGGGSLARQRAKRGHDVADQLHAPMAMKRERAKIFGTASVRSGFDSI